MVEKLFFQRYIVVIMIIVVHNVNFAEGLLAKVIDKTFGILEAIAVNAPRPMTPAELAERLGINRTTCSRLLKILLDSGYVLRVSRQAGYVPGPGILALSNVADFQGELISGARPVVERCAQKLGKLVLLAQLYGGRRYIICHKNCDPGQNIRLRKLAFDDLFATATGLLLLAYCDKAEQKLCYRIQKDNGGEFFPELDDWESCSRLLADIRKKGYYACAKDWQWIYAYPVFRNGKFCAAFGVSILKSEHTPEYDGEIRSYLQSSAESISAAISHSGSIG